MDDAADARDEQALRDIAGALAAAVPALVERLSAARPRRLYRDAVELLERPLLAHVLTLTHGNQLQAARLLGLNRNTLRKRCRALGLAAARKPRRVVV